MIDGLNTDAMIVGLMSAVFITFWLDTIDNLPKAASAALFSGLLSGIASPLITTYVISNDPLFKNSGESLSLLAAAIIGGSVTWGLPIIIIYVRNKWGKPNV